MTESEGEAGGVECHEEVADGREENHAAHCFGGVAGEVVCDFVAEDCG